MKYIIAFIITIASHGAEWNDPALPMANTDKPVYQWAGWPPPGNMWIGGRCTKVRIPSADDLKQQLQYEYDKKIQDIRIAEIKRGSWLFMVGLVGVGIGAILHCLTAYPALQRVSEWVIVGGLSCSALGLLMKKAAEYQNWIVLGMVVLIIGYALYRFRDWSVSHIFNRNKSTDNGK